MLERLVEERLSPKRFGHSSRTAELAATLARDMGYDPGSAFAAGILHDACKELPAPEQKALAFSGPEPYPIAIAGDDRIVHGPAAAEWARATLGLGDADLLEAIAYHSTGREGMGPVAVIVFAADKLEPGRGRRSETMNRELAGLSLDDLLAFALDDTIAFLRSVGEPVAEPTLLLYHRLKERTHEALCDR